MRTSVDFVRRESNRLRPGRARRVHPHELGYLNFVDEPDEDARAAVESAVRACPSRAIRIVEEVSAPDSPRDTELCR
jgi:hypothetical protein